jgi:hypothetical protein
MFRGEIADDDTVTPTDLFEDFDLAQIFDSLAVYDPLLG